MPDPRVTMRIDNPGVVEITKCTDEIDQKPEQTVTDLAVVLAAKAHKMGLSPGGFMALAAAAGAYVATKNAKEMH